MIRWCGLFAAWLWSGQVLSEVSGAAASAAVLKPVTGANRVAEGIDMTVLGQLLAGLVLVLALFMGLAWLVKRSGMAGGFSQQGLKVVASLPLSARERVVLVQVGTQQLLLGVAPGRVNLLQSFDQPLVLSAAPASPSFSHWLQRAKAKLSAADDDSVPNG